jgi:hypothetical protein
MLANFMFRSLWRNDLVASESSDAAMPVLHIDGSETVEQLVGIALEQVPGPVLQERRRPEVAKWLGKWN